VGDSKGAASYADRPTPILGAVLCGGQSSRFGTDKALVDVDGRPLAARIIDALRGAGADPVVAVGGSAGLQLGVPTIADRHPGQGPLAALGTVLLWARTGLVVVTSCDVPLLTAAHVKALLAAAAPNRAAVATVDDRPQPSLACWPAGYGSDIAAMVKEGRRTWRSALDAGPWVRVELPPESVADADTPAELSQLLSNHPPVDRS